jgi:alpha/beta superfamily hydrolase
MEAGWAEKIRFSSESLHLEGLLIRGRSPKAVIISHPHPLYGGDMHNHVVGLAAEAFNDVGWTTLRFNFRGVGRSEGDFDQGLGEQEDVLAAITFLQSLGMDQIILAGYSFGAWVNAQAAKDNQTVNHSILVSPPLAMMDFSFLKDDSKTALLVVGDRDPFCPQDDLRKLLEAWSSPPPLKIIPEADHFFSQGSAELLSAIKDLPLLKKLSYES